MESLYFNNIVLLQKINDLKYFLSAYWNFFKDLRDLQTLKIYFLCHLSIFSSAFVGVLASSAVAFLSLLRISYSLQYFII